MRNLIIRVFTVASLLTLISLVIASPADTNPLLAKWLGPYGGVPPFDRVQVLLFKPALEAAQGGAGGSCGAA